MKRTRKRELKNRLFLLCAEFYSGNVRSFIQIQQMSPKVVLAYFNSELCAARETKSSRKKFLNYSAGNQKKINPSTKNFFRFQGMEMSRVH